MKWEVLKVEEEEETEQDALKAVKVGTEWDALKAVEVETEWDVLKPAEEENVVRLVVKAKTVEEKQMKEVEVMVELVEVVEEKLAVAAPTVAVVELQEEVKESLAVAVGEETPQVVLAEEEEEVIHLVGRL